MILLLTDNDISQATSDSINCPIARGLRRVLGDDESFRKRLMAKNAKTYGINVFTAIFFIDGVGYPCTTEMTEFIIHYDLNKAVTTRRLDIPYDIVPNKA